MQTVAQSVNGHNAYPMGMTQMQPALAEAQCSVNLFFEVEGYGKGQATGRGKNAQEAAANLKATIDATRAALAPVAPATPPSREAQVATLMAKGIACAVAKQDLCLLERIGKAAYLVLSNAIESTDSPTVMAVRSMAHPDSWYEVDTLHSYSCTCADWRRHHKAGEAVYSCKHSLSVIMQGRLKTTE